MMHRLLIGLIATGVALGPARAGVAAIDCDNNGTGTDPINNITINGGQINMAGASLFIDFFRQAASTNDWIDVDSDGFFGFVNPDPNFLFVDQLATTYSPGAPLNTWWALNYRSVGSVNGFGEFIDSQLCGTVNTNGVPSEGGLFNRFQYATSGAITAGFGDYVNATGTPLQQCSIDAAVLDVPGSWAVVGLGTEDDARWDRNPDEIGYGLNPIPTALGAEAQLQQLSRGCTSEILNFDTASPDLDTLYSLTTAWVPVAIIANRGTGIENVRFSELQYLWVTGRMPNGMNLVGATRDVGSGTRNAGMNSLNIDPSWARGENLGAFTESSSTDLLGPVHQPSNKGGSSRMEGAVQNNRLAIGYTGLAGGDRAARDASRGFYEVVNVCKDVDETGAPLCDCAVDGYVRPNIDTTLDNCDACAGYQIAGFESFVVRGNIDANRDPSDPKYNGSDPALENQALADYLNNLFDSIDLFTGSVNGGSCGDSYVCSGTSGLNCVTDADCGVGNGTCTTIRPCSQNSDCDAGDFCGQIVNSPGQSLATSFFLPAALDCVSSNGEPMAFHAIEVNANLQEYTRASNGLGWGSDTPAYGSANVAGLVPNRYVQAGGVKYTDGQANLYIYWTGSAFTTIAGGSRLSARNRVQGDFNEDFALDVNDATELVKAYYTPRAWQQSAAAIGAGSTGGQMTADNAIPEVLGDFDGNGHLSKEDLRYFADGLAMVGGKLDRKAGAIAIDTEIAALGKPYPWADTNSLLKVAPVAAFGEPTFVAPASVANYLAGTGNAYKPGDFRGDVAGAQPVPGANPRGWDGRIDAADIDYVCHNIHDWSNLDEAVFMDLSCDMNGDLDVDAGDVAELVTEILGTSLGDANLNGTTTDDLAIVDATIAAGTAGCNGDASCGWSDGDFNCDGIVDAADRGILVGDCTGDGVVTVADVVDFVDCLEGPMSSLGVPACSCADIDGDGDVDLLDYALLQQAL